VSYKCSDTIARTDIPNLGCIVERSCEDFVSLCVETYCNDFLFVALQFVDQAVEGNPEFPVVFVKSFNGAFYVVDSGCAVQTASSYESGVRVESDPTDLPVVSNQLGNTLARGDVPDVCRAVEGPGHNLVPERVVERESLHNVVVAHKGVEFLRVLGVLQPTGPVLTACDETSPIFVETHVGQREIVALDLLLVFVLLVLGVFLLLYEFEYQVLESVPAFLSYDLLLLQDGLDQVVYVSLPGQVQEVD